MQILCVVCGKSFEAKRKDAKCCSWVCRNKLSTDKSSPKKEIIPPKIEVEKEVVVPGTPKPSYLCKVDSCNLPSYPGHREMCIYHWKIDEGMAHISEEDYNTLNKCPKT